MGERLPSPQAAPSLVHHHGCPTPAPGQQGTQAGHPWELSRGVGGAGGGTGHGAWQPALFFASGKQGQGQPPPCWALGTAGPSGCAQQARPMSEPGPYLKQASRCLTDQGPLWVLSCSLGPGMALGRVQARVEVYSASVPLGEDRLAEGLCAEGRSAPDMWAFGWTRSTGRRAGGPSGSPGLSQGEWHRGRGSRCTSQALEPRPPCHLRHGACSPDLRAAHTKTQGTKPCVKWLVKPKFPRACEDLASEPALTSGLQSREVLVQPQEVAQPWVP